MAEASEAEGGRTFVGALEGDEIESEARRIFLRTEMGERVEAAVADCSKCPARAVSLNASRG